MKHSINKILLPILIFAASFILTYCSKEESPVAPEPPLILLYPNGGENIYADSLFRIQWSSANVEIINIHFSSNSGNDWNVIATSVNAGLGEWDWTTPNITSDNGKIRILSYANASINDESDSNFSIIVDASLNLLIPNGGEVWESLTEYPITWTAENLDNIIIEFTSDNGNNWQIIDTVSASLDEYIWKTHYQPSADCRVSISSLEYPLIKDISDNNFTIIVAPRITESLEYYPITIGDKWVYEVTATRYPDTINHYYSIREAIDYVQMPNGKYYFEFSSYYRYERIDSLIGFVYRYFNYENREKILEDLLAEPGTDCLSTRYHILDSDRTEVVSEYLDTLFGVPTISRGYVVHSEPHFHYKLSKYFGLTYISSSIFEWTTYTKLVGAYISGIVYGDTTTVTGY